MINDLDYERIKFPVSKKVYYRTKRQNNTCINVFCYENNLIYPVYVSDQKFENCMDLFLISDKNKSHHVYIKDFNRFMCNKNVVQLALKIISNNYLFFLKSMLILNEF